MWWRKQRQPAVHERSSYRPAQCQQTQPEPEFQTNQRGVHASCLLLRFSSRFSPLSCCATGARNNVFRLTVNCVRQTVSDVDIFILQGKHHGAKRGGDVAQLLEHRTGTPPTQVRFPGAARDFSPRVIFQCRLSYGVGTPPCAIACIYVCAHVKDPVVHVRVWWITETLKHPACTGGWVAGFPPGKATRISHGRNPYGTIQL